MNSICEEILSLNNISSPSRKKMYSPNARLIPIFLDSAGPLLVFRKIDSMFGYGSYINLHPMKK
jgi:hypothetical protein